MALMDLRRKIAKMEEKLSCSPADLTEQERESLISDAEKMRYELRAVQLIEDLHRKYGEHEKADQYKERVKQAQKRLQDAQERFKAAGITEDDVRRFLGR